MKTIKRIVIVLALFLSINAFQPAFAANEKAAGDQTGKGEVKAGGTLDGEQVCVDKSIEKELWQCPAGAKKGKYAALKSQVTMGKAIEKPKVVKKEQMKPGLDKEIEQIIKMSAFKKTREVRSLKLLQQEISLLDKLVKQTPDSNADKPEILKRLGDSYLDMYQQITFMARERDEPIFQAKKEGKKSEVTRLKSEQKALEGKAKEFRKQAIETFIEIRNRFSDFANFDEVLYSIGYSIDQMATEEESKDKKSKYRERAREFYQELIKGYPRSKYIPFAWMSFADYFFSEAKDVDKALKSYEKVVEWGEENNPSYVLAMYYIAWCYFNQQDFQKTINQFVKVIKYAGDHAENNEAKAVSKRSKLEMIDAYSKIGNPSKAWDFFQQIGGDMAFAMLEKLAEQYYDEGHWADAIIVYHNLIKIQPEGESACNYQISVTNAVISSRPKDEQLAEIKRLVSFSKVYADAKHKDENVKRCKSEAAQIAVDTATHWHVEAVGSESSPGTNDKSTMQLTSDLYTFIIEQYPDIDDAKLEGYNAQSRPTQYRLAYYKAELLWKMEKWNECAPAFDKVVELDPKGQYVESAAYAAVLCYNNVYQQERPDDRTRRFKLKTDTNTVAEDKKPSKSEGKAQKPEKTAKPEKQAKGKKKAAATAEVKIEKRDLTEVEKGMLKAYERYICYVAEGEDLVRIKYRRARIYYEANWLAEAAVLFKDIAYKHSDAPEDLGVYAANLYLDCLNAIGMAQHVPSCYDDLAVSVDEFLNTSKLPGKNLMTNAEFSDQIKQLKCGVLRKKAESLKDRARFKEAALTFLEIYQDYGTCGDMDVVLWNAAINFEAGRLLGPAIKTRELLIEKFPDSEWSKKALYFIGQNYHAVAIYSKAADYYEQFATKYSGEADAPLALKNATTFRIGLGQNDKALADTSLFEKNYKTRRPSDSASVFFGVGGVYLDSDDYENTIKHYTKYLSTYAKTGNIHEIVVANVKIAEAYEKRKRPDPKMAIKYYQAALNVYDGGKAMEKVKGEGATKEEQEASGNLAKAQMLIAGAQAQFAVADLDFNAFKSLKFPELKIEKTTPATIKKWYDKDIGPEGVKEEKMIALWRRYNLPPSERKKEEDKYRSSVQFQYWLKNKFVKWVTSKQELLNKAETSFAKVLEFHVPQWEIAAAARVGDMKVEFMQSLYDAPVPPDIAQDVELKTIYQQSLDEKAQPYRDGAVNAYQHCIVVATKVRWFSDDSVRCEARLNKLDPRQFPISDEYRTMPTLVGRQVAYPQLVDHLETAAEKRERRLTEGAAAAAGAKEDTVESSGAEE